MKTIKFRKEKKNKSFQVICVSPITKQYLYLRIFFLLFIQSKLKYPRWPLLMQGYPDPVDFIALILPQKSVLSFTWAQWLTHMQVTVKFYSGYFLSLFHFSFLVFNYALLSQLHTIYVTLSIFSFFRRHVKAC